MYDNPTLIEPGVKYFMRETLKNCYSIKERYYNIFFNLILICSFIVILGITLYYRYKGKLSPKEIQKKEIKKQQYIMSMIRNNHSSKKAGNITGLPEYTHERDIIH
jgi:hypothetical protein|tara:strand:- start:119 stop:436 length:318 start_codon:yes stop_codon:yes gene_type:complete